MASTLARRAGEERVEAGGKGSMMGIRLTAYFFSKTREMTCGWDVEFDERETNGVSLDVGWKMIYRVI
jgi:hypothetical protein